MKHLIHHNGNLLRFGDSNTLHLLDTNSELMTSFSGVLELSAGGYDRLAYPSGFMRQRKQAPITSRRSWQPAPMSCMS